MDSADNTWFQWSIVWSSYVSVCEYLCVYSLLEFSWVSWICGLLSFGKFWSLCLQIYFSVPFSFFTYKQMYFHWVFKKLFVFTIYNKWIIYLLKVISTKTRKFLIDGKKVLINKCIFTDFFKKAFCF